MKKYIPLILTLFVLAGCRQSGVEKPRKVTIGFSQCTTRDDWRKTMIEEMKREIGFHTNYEIELIIKDADDDTKRQIRDIEELMSLSVDLLIVSPKEAAPLTPIVEQVYDRHIPVIIVDRSIDSEKFTSYIGGDNFAIGKEAAMFAGQSLHGKGKVMEITGLVASTPAQERSRGFYDGLKEFPGITVVKTLNGAWLKKEAQAITDTLFHTWTDFDLIFAHNDQMANGASLSASKYGLQKQIIGVDGLYVPGGGVDMVLNGDLDGTFFYPTGGDKALDLALTVLEGKPFVKVNLLKTFRIDSSNAHAYKMQATQLIDQEKKIDFQRERIGEMSFLLKKKETMFLLLTVISVLLVVLAATSIYFMVQKSKANRDLDLKSKTIEDKTRRLTKQRNKLLQALRLAEEAIEAKIRFFTNVSHEIRTVLSLISLPVHQLSSSSGDLPEGKVQMLKQSVKRLLTLSEEILDFRKTNHGLHFQTSDLGAFLLGVAKVFEQKAIEKELILATDIQPHLDADFDPGVIEKVMFNLISNSIKYTKKGGRIDIRAITKGESVQVSVEDTGIGIPEEELTFIFDRFYRGRSIQEKTGELGCGVGLDLSRELLQLHGGAIAVESRLNKGSIFTFSIPRKIVVHPTPEPDKHTPLVDDFQKGLIETSKKKKILLVEDVSELRAVMGEMLTKHYSVLMAKNGLEGFELAKKLQPDLIISDILMPEMDGIELCGKLKSDPASFHIPVMLLTAMNSETSFIKSFEIGADAYLTKPCHEKVLLSRIHNLIASRQKLKDGYGKPLFSFGKLLTNEKSDENFVHLCLDEIHKEISNPNFSLFDLARGVGMSRSSLYRKIKEVTGLKAVDFLKKAKLQYAAKLLVNYDLTISEVAWQSGFSDAKYFSKVFAKEFGELPSKFREQIAEHALLPEMGVNTPETVGL